MPARTSPREPDLPRCQVPIYMPVPEADGTLDAGKYVRPLEVS